MDVSLRINITGVVQGVGFRPFAANLAQSLGVLGSIQNTGGGVEIFVTAKSAVMQDFVDSLKHKKPPQSHIAEFDVAEIPYTEFSDFRILPSEFKETATPVFIPADMAICADCEREMNDPNNRRYGYPFINCTQCGPRYSIITALPYDRDTTTMAMFQMCAECRKEYDDPTDRRYHAQPNACPVCGPNVWMRGLHGDDAIKYAAELIDSGEIIAMKGLGGYHLICDATNDNAVTTLRKHKHRNTKPLAVMCDMPAADTHSEIAPAAPIIISRWGEHPLSPLINPLDDHIGLMPAYTPLHKLLLGKTNTKYIVATSGNRHDEPISANEKEAEETLREITPHFLHHNRPIHNRIDDSVAVHVAGRLRLLRRGRGYAPFPVHTKKNNQKIFAAGSQLKSAIAFTKGAYTFVSQYIGDLDNTATVDFYRETYENMRRILNITPDIAVCDKHNGYFSTTFAESLEIPVIRVQHHHAHLYAVMAEYGLTDNVIGLIMDGTGYGDDGAIWGGEVFTLENGVLERKYHLEYVPQAAGDASVRYPCRMAQSWLMAAGVWSDFWRERMGMTETDAKLNGGMIKNNINTIPTSSAGRLFESVGAMVLGINKNEYEAHAAMALEATAGSLPDTNPYPYEISDGNIIMTPVIRAIWEDISGGVNANKIAQKFHNTFAMALTDCAIRLSKSSGIKRVAISGGVFQNRLLLEHIEKLLVKAGLTCYIPINIPANDGCIALGQAYSVVIK